MLGFSVYISNTTKKEDGVLCFKDTIYTRATIPNPIIVTCPYHGRYVIYYNERTNPPYPDDYSGHAANDLCEVQVYGKPWLEKKPTVYIEASHQNLLNKKTPYIPFFFELNPRRYDMFHINNLITLKE